MDNEVPAGEKVTDYIITKTDANFDKLFFSNAGFAIEGSLKACDGKVIYWHLYKEGKDILKQLSAIEGVISAEEDCYVSPCKAVKTQNEQLNNIHSKELLQGDYLNDPSL